MTIPPSGPRGRVLVIGYGNSLRGDDGAGWHAAVWLADDPRMADAEVLARHQLTPELAEDLALARLVVLVDACHGTSPGMVSIRRVEPRSGSAPTWSHHLDPGALISLAETLFSASPPMFLITVVGASFGYGDQVSPAVRRALPDIADTVARLQTDTGRANALQGGDLRTAGGQ